MSGTTAGGKKAAQTNKERYGSMFYVLSGAKGGRKTGIAKGFALQSYEQHKENSRKGGLKSRRGKA